MSADKVPADATPGSPKQAPGSIYERAMGKEFARLAEPVQRFHRLQGHQQMQGWVQTQAPATMAAALLARLLGTPLHTERGPIRFELISDADTQRWIRHFPSQMMTSNQRLLRGRLVESLGPARLTFGLQERATCLEISLVGMHLCGISCPTWLLPQVFARESGEQTNLRFQVRAHMRWAGVIAEYEGVLDLPGELVS